MFKYLHSCDGEMKMGVSVKCDGVGVLGQLYVAALCRGKPTDLSARMGVGVWCESVGVMSPPPFKYFANPRIYPQEWVWVCGVSVWCESVGVMSPPSFKYFANPRIYPWEATHDPSP